MELDKQLMNQSLQELEALENETKQLLESIRGKPKDKKNAIRKEKSDSKTKNADQSKSAKSAGKLKGKKTLLSKSQSLSAVGNRPAPLSSDVLFSSNSSNTNEGRITVEVLDDASPDGTPREASADEHRLQLQRDKAQLNSLRESEFHFRKLQFNDERSRVVLGADTFVPGPGLSAADVDKERLRLALLEESARRRQQHEQSELRAHRDFLLTDKAALQVQRLFRGFIGRQKFTLTARIKKMHDDDKFGDWIEVNDPATGDIWYYNKESQLSQWEKPAALNRKKQPQQQQQQSKLPSIAGGSISSAFAATAAASGARNLSVSMALPSIDALQLAKHGTAAATAHSNRPHSTGNGSRVSSPQKLKKTMSFKATQQQQQQQQQQARESRAQLEVNHILGIDKINTQEALTAPDGSFKPQLRTVVLDALLDTRFDSVATVLADQRWFDSDQEHFQPTTATTTTGGGSGSKKKARGGFAGAEDLSRAPMVSQLTFNAKKTRHGKPLNATDGSNNNNNNNNNNNSGEHPLVQRMESLHSAQDLTFKEVEHTGFETFGSGSFGEIMCFGCWSAGQQRKCELHHGEVPLKPSQTMLLCRNWQLDVMRRRYRAEEIQELFLQREASLRYDVKHKKFSTVVEQRHPIYRFHSQLHNTFIKRMVLFERIKRWLLSLAEELRVGHISDRSSEATARLMRIKRNAVNFSKLTRFSQMNRELLPAAPLTGSSWPERSQQAQYLFRQWDAAIGSDVDLITVLPTPVPKFLYLPREYHIGVPKTIPMPRPSYLAATAIEEESSDYTPPTTAARAAASAAATAATIAARVQPSNTYIREDSDAAWIEKMSAAIARDTLQAAKSQVLAFTPLTEAGIVSRTLKPAPSTIKAATIARKPCPQNLAVGGLALELLVYQLVSTYIPTQYGSFMVTEKGSVSPGVSAEVSISFQSLAMAPVLQQHMIRPLEHPLNYRRAPTITLNCNIDPDADRHFYGSNRPEQTGEQDAHGFRTTSWAPMLLTYVETDPQTFVPGQEVVSLNDPKANVSCTTHADYTYPFCEPSTRDNSTLDFYHLLLAGVVAHAQPQVFTALTVQEPGTFLHSYRADNPMGHLLVNVYRSWAFTQKDTIQEFRTDDGVSYWYHRKTGQTFWERPLHEAEEQSPLLGGTLLQQATEHCEEPSELAKSAAGATRRHSQGEFRQLMLQHVETKKDALQRRKAAAATVKGARERGTLPLLEGAESLVNHAHSGSSAELVSRLDFPQMTNSSMLGGFPTQSDNAPYHSSGGGGSIVEYGDPLPSADGYVAAAGGNELAHLHPYNVQQDQLTAGGFIEAPVAATAGFGASAEFDSRPATGAAAAVALRRGSFLDDASVAQHHQQQQQLQQSSSIAQSMPNNMFVGPNAGFPGLDTNMVQNMSHMLNNMMNTMMLMDSSNPQAMLTMGMSMGMALMQTNAVNDMVTNQVQQQQYQQQPPQFGSGGYGEQQRVVSSGGGDGAFPTIPEESGSQVSGGSSIISGHIDYPAVDDDAAADGEQLLLQSHSQRSQPSRVSAAQSVSMLEASKQPQPIGVPHPTVILSADKSLDHSEELNQRLEAAQRTQQPLSTMQQARNLKRDPVKPTDTPDMLPVKSLTDPKPSNAELGLIEEGTTPVLAYPELSTQGSTHIPYRHRPPAGEGSSFVSPEAADAQQLVAATAAGAAAANLRRTVMPLPVGFFEAIEAKHVAKQAADYLPQVPNLPQARNIGRVKPRSAALDWLMISFDPWSAGKNPLSTEFVNSMMEKAEKFVEGGPAKAQDAFEQLRQSTLAGAYIKTEDAEGLAQQRAEITRAEHLAQDFKLICSLCRHSKFADAEQMMNQPDWSVPIDYQDDQGNTLLHIVSQNGNKRMVKLCLRRGAALDVQNLTGQTPLHFAYGYGYADVGDYLLQKGADDSVRNKDGLTCYEGLGAKELELL